VPQSTPTEEACIIIEETAWVNQFNGNQPRILSVYSQDASTQCFVITRSQYTQTDSVASPVPQLVKTSTNARTQVKLITESPDGANTGLSSHSSHLNDEKKKKLGGIYFDYRPVDCDKSDKKKQESEENINSDSKPKKLTLFEQVYPSDEESPNDPPLSPLAANDDDDHEEYTSETTDSAGSSSDDTDYELDS